MIPPRAPRFHGLLAAAFLVFGSATSAMAARPEPFQLPADAPVLVPGSSDIAHYLAYWQTLAARRSLERTIPMTANQQSYDVRTYDLDLHPNIGTGGISGSVRVRATVLSGPLGTIDLDLDSSYLTVDAATCAGASAPFVHAAHIVTVTLDHPYGPGQTIDVTIAYHGVPQYPSVPSYAVYNVGGKPLLWTLSEPFDAHTWWPCKDQPDDKADSVDIRVTVPTGMITASNGVRLESTDNGTVAFTHWRERHPISSYLVSLASHAYSTFSDWYHATPTDSMEIQFYYYPDAVGPLTPLSLEVKTMLSVFSTRFGPYPFLDEKYGHAHIPFGGGMEHQTCSSIGSYEEFVVAHELAHQWWGDLVTCRDFHHIWLNEGFATYAEALWLEAKSGVAAYRADLDANRFYGGGTIYRPDYDNGLFDGDLVYNKGSWVLHMLRHVVGDSAFFSTLRNYRNQYGYSNAVTEDFREVAEAASGRDLTKFFDEWIYGERYPVYLLGWSSHTAVGGYDVTVNIRQTQPWQTFWMPIDVTISTPSGDTTLVARDSLVEQNFVFHITGEPLDVQLDKDGWILRSPSTGVAVETGGDATTLQLAPPVPNPSRGVTSIECALPRAGLVRVAVVDAAGRRVAQLHEGLLSAGPQRFAWDGRTAAGDRAPGGLYWITVEQAGERRARRFALIR